MHERHQRLAGTRATTINNDNNECNNIGQIMYVAGLLYMYKETAAYNMNDIVSAVLMDGCALVGSSCVYVTPYTRICCKYIKA